MKQKPTICLNMIVKNETPIILECLNSIYKYIDYWVINDTGSTDGTQDMIRTFFKEKNIPGEIIEHEFRTCKCHTEGKQYDFFHFGLNRSYALEACKGKGDYIWVMDADDKLIGDLKLPKKMNKDVYYMVLNTDSTIFKRQLIFKNSSNWRFVCGLHETSISDKPNLTVGTIENKNFYICARSAGNRSLQKNRFINDIDNLEQLIQNEPENRPRYLFYAGQTNYWIGNYYMAIHWYKERNKMINDLNWEETFYSNYALALCYQKLNYPYEEIQTQYLKAWQMLPIRSEPLYNLANLAMKNKKFDDAYKYSLVAHNIKFPIDLQFLIEEDVYKYNALFQFVHCSYFNKKYVECLDAIDKLLNEKNYPFKYEEYIKTSITTIIKEILNESKKTLI